MEPVQVTDDIHFLRKMIENNRRVLVDNGIAYISAGVYQVIGSISTYVLIQLGYERIIPVLWVSLMVLLIGFNLVAGRKAKSKQPARTFAQKTFTATWTACAIPIIIVSLMFFISGTLSLITLFVAVTAIMGIGYYITGYINDLSIMKLFAFGWWLGTVLSAIWPLFGKDYQLALFFCFLFTVLELIPGIIIYTKWKKLYHE